MQCVIGSSNLLIELIIWEVLIYAGQGRQCTIDMNFSFATTYKLQKAHRNQAEELFHFTESSFLYNKNVELILAMNITFGIFSVAIASCRKS